MSDALSPRKRYVVELSNRDGDRLSYHLITYGGYRQVVSAGAFFDGVRKLDRDVKRGVIWPSHLEYEHHHYTRKDVLGFSLWPEYIEFVEHESIWAFYKYIGYDYKKKKFV
jgi:hypothetical protein